MCVSITYFLWSLKFILSELQDFNVCIVLSWIVYKSGGNTSHSLEEESVLDEEERKAVSSVCWGGGESEDGQVFFFFLFLQDLQTTQRGGSLQPPFIFRNGLPHSLTTKWNPFFHVMKSDISPLIEGLYTGGYTVHLQMTGSHPPKHLLWPSLILRPNATSVRLS